MKAQPSKTPGTPRGSASSQYEGAIPGHAATSATTTSVELPCFDDGALERLTEVVELPVLGTAAPAPRVLTRAPYLVVLTGDQEGRVINLPREGNFVIGRADTCEFQVEDDGMSRAHARLVVSGSTVVLEDLGSRNGTFIGSQLVKQQRLRGDEIIRVGARTVLKFSMMDRVEEEYLRRLLAAALKDPLTQLYNRRHFDERVATACAGAQRHNEPFSLVIADIDNFKHVNDTYGHPIGDVALRAVAEVLTRGARREDEIFRYGGEEFALLMRNTAEAGAAEVAERMRRAIEQHHIPLERGSLRITVSLGVAQFARDEGMDALFLRADKALYQAKRNHKNCVVCASRAG